MTITEKCRRRHSHEIPLALRNVFFVDSRELCWTGKVAEELPGTVTGGAVEHKVSLSQECQRHARRRDEIGRLAR